jgi:hypothetical protein
LNNPSQFISIITTIQSPTAATRLLADRMRLEGGQLLVVGDRKGPHDYPLEGTVFFSLREQQAMEFGLTRLLPTDHYGRKNLGYLQAIKQGATCIYETDDDNAPLPGWQRRSAEVQAIESNSKEWVNAYRHFSSHNIWPRGFPLDELQQKTAVNLVSGNVLEGKTAPIQQGLANGSPDVDAIWRLVLDESIEFEEKPSIWLPPGSWCPFNSQSTWWWPEAYPLLYLPSFCSFRMTDIWRSFVAQRCLWAMGYGLVFHAAEVVQERNEHNLMRDFSDEVVGYLRNKELVALLTALELKPGVESIAGNLLQCYEILVQHEFFPTKELDLVKAWLADLEVLGGH